MEHLGINKEGNFNKNPTQLYDLFRSNVRFIDPEGISLQLVASCTDPVPWISEAGFFIDLLPQSAYNDCLTALPMVGRCELGGAEASQLFVPIHEATTEVQASCTL